MKQRLPNIEAVAASFAAWRNHRQNRAEQIPDELWQQVFSLLPHYPSNQIMRCLGLSGAQLKQLKARLGKIQKKKTAALEQDHDGFALAVPPILTQDRTQQRCHLIFSGACKKMQVELNVSDLQALLPSLLEVL